MRKLAIAVMTALAMILAMGASGLLWAVDPPSVGSRDKAEVYHQKQVKEKIKEQRASGCEYGKDGVTGKCYEPKEGQFYRDPNTGKVKVKKIKKVNTPWK